MKPWYILLAILAFGVLVLIHELGHFLCARARGVEVKEFAIGMGPRICGWTSRTYGTKYSLRVLPIGGYVSMLGEDEESDSENSFGKKSVWSRIAIVVSGPLMNLLLGFLVMILLVSLSGSLYSNEVYYPQEEIMMSEANGLKEGDRIVSIGGTPVHTRFEVVYEIARKGIEPLDITVIRDGEKLTVENVIFPTYENGGVVFGGVDFYAGEDSFGLGNVLKHSFYRSVSTVKTVIDSFVDLVRGRYGLNAVSGPVGVTEIIVDAAESGIVDFLYIIAVITINLGIFNLFPIPALDGGRLVFLLIEAVIGRPVNPKVEGYIHAVGMLLLLLLFVVITFKDVLGLF